MSSDNDEGWQLWFVRRGADVQGPYPAGLIARYLVLGRVKLQDHVSVDQQEWRVLYEVPELIPDVMSGDMSDPLSLDRLMAARRWEDERRQEERRGPDGNNHPIERRRADDRRKRLAEGESKQQRIARATTVQESGSGAHLSRWGGAISLVVLLLSASAWLFYRAPPIVQDRACEAPPAPGVNWNNCDKQGVHYTNANLNGARLRSTNLSGANMAGSRLSDADMSYGNYQNTNLSGADLRSAILLGANLRGTDFSHANLDHANLAYADLTGATLTAANMAFVSLGKALWVDGRSCADGSVGRCIPGVDR